MQAMEWVKVHPKTTAAIVFGVGLLAIILIYDIHGSSGGTSTGASDYAAYQQAAAAEAASGNALQAMQAQLQAADNQTQAGVTSNATNDAAAVSVAQINANAATTQAQVAAASAGQVAQYNAQASETASTMAANVAEANDQSSLMGILFGQLGIGNQMPAAGTAIQSSGQVYGSSIAGTINYGSLANGTPAGFNITDQALLTNTLGEPSFITDPLGNVYKFSTIQPGDTPPPGSTTGGANGYGTYIYSPVTGTQPVVAVTATGINH